MYSLLSMAFCVIVILSNIISAKMVPCGVLLIPVGVFTYPLTFLLSDLVVEFYGAKKAKRMVYTTLGMNVLAFGLIQIALLLPGQSAEISHAYRTILGLSGLRIFSSLTAYTIAQLIDVQFYAWIKQWTGQRFLWVRSNGSTGISQIVDTVLLDLIYLFGGMKMPMIEVVPIMFFSIAYKLFFSFALTPLFYLSVFLIRRKSKLFSY